MEKWRRRRDSNPRYPCGVCSFSKRVPSASRPRLRWMLYARSRRALTSRAAPVRGNGRGRRAGVARRAPSARRWRASAGRAGCAAHEIKAFTGHTTLKEVGHDTAAVSREHLAASATSRAVNAGGTPGSQTDLQTASKARGNQRLMRGKWCPELESNQRHCDFQSHALPTELSGRRGREDRDRVGRRGIEADGAAVQTV